MAKSQRPVVMDKLSSSVYGMSNNFLIFTSKDFRASYVCSHLYLYFERPVNPPGGNLLFNSSLMSQERDFVDNDH
jgi:hypothetical protein